MDVAPDRSGLCVAPLWVSPFLLLHRDGVSFGRTTWVSPLVAPRGCLLWSWRIAIVWRSTRALPHCTPWVSPLIAPRGCLLWLWRVAMACRHPIWRSTEALPICTSWVSPFAPPGHEPRGSSHLERVPCFHNLVGWSIGSDKPNEYCRNRTTFIAMIKSNLVLQLDSLHWSC